MPSHYSTIGLPVADEAELVRLAEAVGPLADPIGFDGGVYYPWRDASGAELWLQVNAANEFVGVQPHFAGTGRVVMRLAHRVRPPDAGPFDGGFYGWADPHGDTEAETAGDAPAGVPMVIDSPEFARLTPLDLPATVPMQIAAFAHEIEVFDTEADYHAAQGEDGPHMAAESFVPSGLFRPDGGPETLPEARAILTGRVLSSERRTNAHSNAPFVTALVQCLGGTYDVVIDPTLLDYPPTVGGILSGSFWLSGKVAVE